MRYFFEIGYDGSCYCGWQLQKNAISVQGEVEKKLQKLLGEKISITGSSRTDTGVHCARQFFHLDWESELNTTAFLYSINSILPKDIAIHSIQKTRPEAHARYHATQRHYEYRITRCKNPFLQYRAYHFFQKVNLQTMNKAAELLVGEHDFKAFSKVKTDVNHFICNLVQARWRKKGDLLIFNVSANRFLRGMVRTMVGTLLDIGTGRTTVEDFQKIIDAKDRRKAGAVVPPQGLYLLNVDYAKKKFIR